jgi:hypothetical protein
MSYEDRLTLHRLLQLILAYHAAGQANEATAWAGVLSRLLAVYLEKRA